MPFGDLCDIVSDWTAYRQNELPWGEDDPLFPATKIKALIALAVGLFKVGRIEGAIR